ncbi:hypothetical protein [Rhodococcus spongiicola]|uniref:Uncharacterized protein n=1 Tax=Rhodococcus spongiicola TaxID=2487352 RepID=A0A438B6E3_9NOCA|nr:hypothetical protein [Rhodococcus spongiicola]RVW06528.1 hypothetical protein EF834_03730 [Rhodococcus spongiicola]
MTDLDHTQIRLLVDRLDQIAGWIHLELENTITRQIVFTEKALTRVTTRDEVPLAFNERASDFAHELAGTLRAWTNYVATERNLPWPGDGRAPHFARWLSRHAYDLAATEQATDAYDQILEVYKAAFAIIDRPKAKQRSIDDEQLAQARNLELNARGCVQVAKQLGRWHDQLTQSRIKYLTKTKVLTPLRTTRINGTLTNIYRLGDVLEATRVDDDTQAETG